jgi:hypothetical protein
MAKTKQLSTRIEFPEAVKRKIAQRAMFFCSNPGCLRLTGYGTTEGKARAVAEAAHIQSAAEDGPRSKAVRDAKKIASESNGVWLCKICHDQCDDDPSAFNEALLKKWKSEHELVIRTIVGKDLEAALLNLGNTKRYHQECRDFLSFIEGKRVFYEGLDNERPPHVWDSLTIIRERIGQTRARVNPDSGLFEALNKLQGAIDNFFRNCGAETDLRTLYLQSLRPCVDEGSPRS